MKRISLASLALAALSLSGASCQTTERADSNSNTPANSQSPAHDRAASKPPAAPQTHLKVGDPAPDFALSDTDGGKVRLSDFRGKKNVALAFYVLA
ncbi:MAG: redoxin domain-containing protein, partial [Acidobacteriota bacterium]|nr:redoxin domain-containing protein [Acidobacteriota bacterium]